MTERLELALPPSVGRQKNELNRWLAAKRGGLGGSDAPVAIGLGRFGSRARLWAEMTSQPGFEIDEDQRIRRESERLRWGLLHEENVTLEVARRSGYQMLTPKGETEAIGARANVVGRYSFKIGGQMLLRHRSRPWMHYSPDRYLIERANHAAEPVLLETKTTSAFLTYQWDDVPEHVYIQVQHGLEVSNLNLAIVAVLVGGNELRAWKVERDQDFIDAMVAAEEQFLSWVEKGEFPALENPMHLDTLEVLKKLYPEDNGATVDLPIEASQLAADLEQAKATKKAADLREKELQARLLLWMGENTYGRIPGTDVGFSLKTVKREGYTVAATSYRALRSCTL